MLLKIGNQRLMSFNLVPGPAHPKASFHWPVDDISQASWTRSSATTERRWVSGSCHLWGSGANFEEGGRNTGAGSQFVDSFFRWVCFDSVYICLILVCFSCGVCFFHLWLFPGNLGFGSGGCVASFPTRSGSRSRWWNHYTFDTVEASECL